jgi:hypothetical protein
LRGEKYNGGLKKIWVDATGGNPMELDPYFNFSKRYKTSAEFVDAMSASGKTKSQLEQIWKEANQGTKVDPLIAEAKKYRSADEFVKSVVAKEEPIVMYRTSKSGKKHDDIKDFTYFSPSKEYIQQYMRPGDKIIKYELKPTELIETVKDLEYQYLPDKRNDKIRKLIGTYKEVNQPKIRQMKTSAEIPSLERTAEVEGVKPQEILPAKELSPENLSSQELSLQTSPYSQSVVQDTKEVKDVAKQVARKDETGLAKSKDIDVPDTVSTRQFKQTQAYKDFAKYAESIQGKDIFPAILGRHTTLTAERVAEVLDGGIGGRTYKEMVKPTYEAAEKIVREGNDIKNEVAGFRVIEGSTVDRDASLFAQGKIDKAPEKAQEIAKYVRDKYDDLLTRLNKTREKVGVEPIPKRKDYITHLNELNVLSELFGGMERITIKNRIKEAKAAILDLHPDWSDARAFEAAKKEVEGLQGLAQYVDARQPTFRFAKKRLSEYESDPSIIRSFNAYLPSALRYIHQAKNVARNKAFKDVLPANSREFMRKWNTEQVAGRQAPSIINPVARRALSAVKGTLGANTIVGNLATIMMQLTSFPQVIAMAGPRNTLYGIGKRLRTYIPGQTSLFQESRTRALRNLDTDMGLGNSLIDSMLKKVGTYEKARNTAARTRAGVDFGREMLKGLMETADQFTVGATYEAFYKKALNDGMAPLDAMEYAEILTGKTQANYFKEALPPFLNTFEGKTLGQFGTYSMNQWEMFIRDFGKEFNYNAKSQKSVREVFKQFIVFLTAAYLVDSVSEKTFGRQPYDIKSLTDEAVSFTQGDSSTEQIIDTAKDTAAGYIPYLGSVKFGSAPPLIEFGTDTVQAVLGSGKAAEEARDNFKEKWIYNVLLPYGGNQARKSLQGAEKVSGVDLPFVRNTSKKFDIETSIDKAKAFLFGPYSSDAAQTYFDQVEERSFIKDKYSLSGSITSDENIEKLRKMSDEEFDVYTKDYSESTMKTINRKLGEVKPENTNDLRSILSR